MFKVSLSDRRLSQALRNFWRVPNLLVSVSTLCQRSLISWTGVEHIIDSRCPHTQESRGFRSGDFTGQATGPARPLHLSSYDASKNSSAMRLKYAGAPSCRNHMRPLTSSGSGTSSSKSGKSFSKKYRNSGQKVFWVAQKANQEVVDDSCPHINWKLLLLPGLSVFFLLPV